MRECINVFNLAFKIKEHPDCCGIFSEFFLSKEGQEQGDSWDDFATEHSEQLEMTEDKGPETGPSIKTCSTE